MKMNFIIIIKNSKSHISNRYQITIRNKHSINNIKTIKTTIKANQTIKIIEKLTFLKIKNKIEEIKQEEERWNLFPLRKYKSLVDKILRIFWNTLKLLEILRI